MWWKRCSLLAGTLAVCCALNLVFILYLQFLFPRTVQLWADEGRALSVWERMVAQASDFCTRHGVIFLMLIGLLLVMSVSWWRAIRKLRAIETQLDRRL